jgi:hypothetical protein
VEHQVDKRHELGNSLDWVRCSGKTAFMLMREISVREDIMIPGQEGLILFLFIRRELSRDLNKTYSK